MSKHYQESEIEFKRDPSDDRPDPEARGIVVYQYGGSLEECIAAARKEFDLDDEWEVVNAEAGKL